MNNVFFKKWLDANIVYSKTKTGKTLSLAAYILGWIIAVQLMSGIWTFGFIFLSYNWIYIIFALFMTTLLVTMVYILRCHYLAAKKLNLLSSIDQQMGVVYLKRAMTATGVLVLLIIVVSVFLLLFANSTH